MHAFAIALVIFSAEPTEHPALQIPEKYRDYFAAADFYKPQAIGSAELRLKEARASKRNPDEAKKVLADLKKDQAYACLSENPKPGQMGRINPQLQPRPISELGGGWHAVSIAGGSTLLCRGIDIDYRSSAVIKDASIWEVSDVPFTEIPELAERKSMGSHAILKKVDTEELAKYRKMWDALPKPSKEANKEIDDRQTKAMRGMLNDVRKMQKKQK